MNVIFSETAWEEYLYWQKTDKQMIKAINCLIKDIARNGPAKGKGRPEQLKYTLAGHWSRRINQEHRLIYTIDQNQSLNILKCKEHYR